MARGRGRDPMARYSESNLTSHYTGHNQVSQRHKRISPRAISFIRKYVAITHATFDSRLCHRRTGRNIRIIGC
jgi:hypothetical protein